MRAKDLVWRVVAIAGVIVAMALISAVDLGVSTQRRRDAEMRRRAR